jgi:hypothetical protein
MGGNRGAVTAWRAVEAISRVVSVRTLQSGVASSISMMGMSSRT